MLTIFVMSAGAVLSAGAALLIAVLDGMAPRREDPPAEPVPPPEPPARRVSTSSSLPACGSFW